MENRMTVMRSEGWQLDCRATERYGNALGTLLMLEFLWRYRYGQQS